MKIKVHEWPVRMDWTIGAMTISLSAYDKESLTRMIDSLKKVTLDDIQDLREQLEAISIAR